MRLDREKSSESFPIEFHWYSGDKSWARAIETEPLASVWRRALEARRVVGTGSEAGWERGSGSPKVAVAFGFERQLIWTAVTRFSGRAGPTPVLCPLGSP